MENDKDQAASAAWSVVPDNLREDYDVDVEGYSIGGAGLWREDKPTEDEL